MAGLSRLLRSGSCRTDPFFITYPGEGAFFDEPSAWLGAVPGVVYSLSWKGFFKVLSVGQRILFYPFYGLLHGWSQSFRRDVSQFREDTERAVKHLRFLLKQN